MASEKAISNLKDQSWNSIFDEKHKYENVADVEPLKEGQVIDLGGIGLEIKDFSGHCADDIALYASSVSNGKGGGGRKDFAQSGGDLIDETDQKNKILKFITDKLD